ncbi:MAG: DUF2240 family protein [Halobacteriota archaeon]|nr:DUF2240 family protein [Halobacteriota archaeon]
MGSELKGREFVISQPFKKLGKEKLTVDEFIFALSLDLEWFTPEEAREILDQALGLGLLKKSGDDIEPGFDPRSLEKPPGFRPDINLFSSISCDDLLEQIARESGIGIDEVTKRIEEKSKELGEIVEEEVIKIMVAKELGVSIDEMVDKAYERLFGSAKDEMSN